MKPEDNPRQIETVLVTGFEPFAGEAINPAGEIAQWLDGAEIEGHRVIGAILPCVFGASATVLKKLIQACAPRLIVCLGQAGGRAEISLERVAINVDDAPIPDTAGNLPVDRPIAPRGPAAYWSRLPIKAIVAAVRREGIPASVSQTAGTYVCNHVFYALMHELAHRRPEARLHAATGGFIHVPYLPQQARGHQALPEGPCPPSLPLDAMTRAIEIAVRVSLTPRLHTPTALRGT
ncbi:MAG: pyroglutamyl-peptidase [Chthoniobacter sp.]|jgi:pyroglutamyl-peptidase|nr:pyroglutamyl-peptidase [Chthoniobacter sp.]